MNFRITTDSGMDPIFLCLDNVDFEIYILSAGTAHLHPTLNLIVSFFLLENHDDHYLIPEDLCEDY